MKCLHCKKETPVNSKTQCCKVKTEKGRTSFVKVAYVVCERCKREAEKLLKEIVKRKLE